MKEMEGRGGGGEERDTGTDDGRDESPASLISPPPHTHTLPCETPVSEDETGYSITQTDVKGSKNNTGR